MSDLEPIEFRPRGRAADSPVSALHPLPTTTGALSQVAFDRTELRQILQVYGRQVVAGEWRDYAIDLGREKAVFSIFRRASECPIYRVEKCPRLARKQGAYSIVTPTGLILKRGHDLRRVLSAIDKTLALQLVE